MCVYVCMCFFCLCMMIPAAAAVSVFFRGHNQPLAVVGGGTFVLLLYVAKKRAPSCCMGYNMASYGPSVTGPLIDSPEEMVFPILANFPIFGWDACSVRVRIDCCCCCCSRTV